MNLMQKGTAFAVPLIAFIRVENNADDGAEDAAGGNKSGHRPCHEPDEAAVESLFSSSE